MKPAKPEKLLNRFFAQSLDIKRAATDEMLEPLYPLCRADQTASAANINLSFFGNGF